MEPSRRSFMGVLAAMAGALALPKIARAIEKAPTEQCECACCDAVEVTVGPCESGDFKSVIPLEFSEEAPRTVLVKIGKRISGPAESGAYPLFECESEGSPAIAVLFLEPLTIDPPVGTLFLGDRIGTFGLPIADYGAAKTYIAAGLSWGSSISPGKPLIGVSHVRAVRHVRASPENGRLQSSYEDTDVPPTDPAAWFEAPEYLQREWFAS
jgi:hypothetical protein